MITVKIITFSTGTLLSLFPLEAFTPLGMINEREIIAAIGQRYNFGTTPTLSTYAELETGLSYELGFFATEWGEITINRLSIHNDGVVIRTSKTEYSKMLFDDLTNWLIANYGCRKIKIQSLFLSEIVVEFERPLANILAKYDMIVDIILSSVNEHREVSAAAFNTLSIEFASKSTAVPKFIIERRAGTSVDEEFYFCSAPLTTEGHLQALEKIERLFS